jgi:hypothetical protein
MKKRKWASPRPWFVAMSVILFMAIVILSIFRSQTAQLEQILKGIDRDIDRYQAEEIKLAQTYSNLTSVTAIYRYCKETRGMDKPKQVEKVRITPPHVAAAPALEPQKAGRPSIFSLFGFVLN